VFSLLLVLGFTGCKENETVKKVSDKPTVKIDKQLLQGSWVRTDADYQIKLSDVQDNGTIKAQYFNPGPINVSKAEWSQNGNDLKIIIVLLDENYPGSTYTLNYIKDKNILAGDYFQAVESVTYYVEFGRIE
jgi:hypothetical protein